DVAMLRLLYSAEIRVSELVSLAVDDVRLDEMPVIMVARADRKRVVPIGPAVVAAISAYLNVRRPAESPFGSAAGVLFLMHRGRRLPRQRFASTPLAYAERSGVGRLTLGTVACSLAAHWIAGGRDLSDLQNLLGHVRLPTTHV